MSNEIEAEILKSTGAKKQRDGEDSQEYFTRLLDIAQKLPDDKWENLSTAAKEWINGGITAENDGEKIPAFSKSVNNADEDEDESQEDDTIEEEEDEQEEEEEDTEPQEDEEETEEEDDNKTEEEDEQEEDEEDRESATASDSEDDSEDDEESKDEDEEETKEEDEDSEPETDEDTDETGETEDEEKDNEVKDVDDEDEVVVAKPRRGRPPKNDKDKVAAKPAGKPGRPKKVVEPEPVKTKRVATKTTKEKEVKKPAKTAVRDDSERKFNASAYIITRLLRNPDLTVLQLQEGLEKKGSKMSPQAISSTRSNTRTVRKIAVDLGWREPKA